MALYVKDPEVGRLADRLASARNISKTEAVRQALQHEVERAGATPRLIDEVENLLRELDAKHAPEGPPVDKAFIDSLYEDD